MNYHILTLFPEMVTQGLSESILGRAAKKGLLSVNAVNIRDYTADRHKKVDDYPYGGGAGMLMQALASALDGLDRGLPADLLSEEIRPVISRLGEITGRGAIAPDEVLENIFSKFCIGK